MKKVVSLAVAVATLVGSAVADITFGSWGRGNWVVAANQKQADVHDKDSEAGKQHVIMGAAQSWGEYTPRTALSIHGNGEKVGFELDMFANGGNGIDVGDNAYVWAKPIDQVKIELGKMDNNILRSNACFGMFDQLRVGNVDGNQEGWTFGGQGTTGAIIEVTPIENLLFVASLNFNLDNGDGSWGGKGSDKNIRGTNWGTVFGRQSKYCLGYTIPETATIKLGLFEANKQVTKNKDGDEAWLNYIQVAADITAVENFFVTVGLNIPTVIQNKEHGGDTVNFNGYASYKASDELTAHFRFGTKFCALDKKEGEDGKVGFLVGAGVDYQISDTLSAYAELDYANNIYCNQSTADNMDCFDFGFGVFESLGGNGKIGIGFAGATNNKGFFYVEGEDAEKTAKAFSWAVPVTIQYCF